MKISALGTAFCLFLLNSCSVVANVTLLPDGQAQVSATLSPTSAFLNYWKDLSDLDASLPASPVDVAMLKANLAAQAKLTPPRLARPGVSRSGSDTRLQFDVPDVASVLGSTTLARLTTEGEQTRLTVTLDRKSMQALLSLTTWAKSPALSTVIPKDDARVSAKEYGQLLAYLLEPYSNAAADVIAQSRLELRVTLPSPPVSTEGVTTVSGNTVICRWPLVRVLSLETPLTFSAVY
jgi:hypothetical protein